MADPVWLKAGVIEYASLRIIRRKKRIYTVERTCCDREPYTIEHSNLRKMLSAARSKFERSGTPQRCKLCTPTLIPGGAPANDNGARATYDTVWRPAGAELPQGVLPAATAWPPTPIGLSLPRRWMPR